MNRLFATHVGVLALAGCLGVGSTSRAQAEPSIHYARACGVQPASITYTRAYVAPSAAVSYAPAPSYVRYERAYTTYAEPEVYVDDVEPAYYGYRAPRRVVYVDRPAYYGGHPYPRYSSYGRPYFVGGHYYRSHGAHFRPFGHSYRRHYPDRHWGFSVGFGRGAYGHRHGGFSFHYGR